MLDINELFDKYLLDNSMWRMEGADGILNLENICDFLGYTKGQFFGANSIMNFLADNPGAAESILEFICNHIDKNPKWQENLLKLEMDDDFYELVFTA